MITIKIEKDGNIVKEFNAKTNMPLLDQIVENGVDMASSCRSGSCGICGCIVKEGEELIDKQAFGNTLVGSNGQNVLTCLAGIKEGKEGEVILQPMF